MTRSLPGGRRLPLVLVTVGVAVANVAIVAGLHALGVPLFPESAATAAVPVEERQPTVAVRTGPLPAEDALAAVFVSDPAMLPGAGWRPGSDAGGALGLPFDFACGTPGGPSAVLVESRGWALILIDLRPA